MSAYRSSVTTKIAKVTFGDRAKTIRRLILGWFLVALGVVSAATLMVILHFDLGQYCGFIAAIGVVLLARPGWGVIEVDRNLGAVRVRANGFNGQTTNVAIAEVRGVRIEMQPGKNQGFALSLMLANGRSLPIAHSMEIGPLEPSRVRVEEFLASENVIGPGANVRIAANDPFQNMGDVMALHAENEEQQRMRR